MEACIGNTLQDCCKPLRGNLARGAPTKLIKVAIGEWARTDVRCDGATSTDAGVVQQVGRARGASGREQIGRAHV